MRPSSFDVVTADQRRSFRAGVRTGVPYAMAGLLLGLSFGVLARHLGMSAIETIIMSAVVHAGSAQFTAVSIIGAGGGMGPAVAAAALMNARFLPMGIASAMSFPGGPLKRAAQAQAIVDTSWALSARGDGTYDRWFMFGTTLPQYCAWSGGTIIGAFGGGLLGDPDRLGLDAIFPTFFLALLIGELRAGRRAIVVAILGALIALALVPFTPPGVPVLAASLAVVAGMWRNRDVA